MDKFVADERTTMEWMPDVQREQVAGVLSGLDDTARARLVPSLTTPLGFLGACGRSREIAAAHHLDEQFPWHQGPVSLRFSDVHMIAELARHAGHGDILTEQTRAPRDL